MLRYTTYTHNITQSVKLYTELPPTADPTVDFVSGSITDLLVD